MIDREHIDRLTKRVGELEAQMALPEVAANHKKLSELVKEHVRLRRVLEKTNEYFRLKQETEETGRLLKAPDTDEELRALAAEELPKLEAALSAAEQEAVAAMLPADPSLHRGRIRF